MDEVLAKRLHQSELEGLQPCEQAEHYVSLPWSNADIPWPKAAVLSTSRSRCLPAGAPEACESCSVLRAFFKVWLCRALNSSSKAQYSVCTDHVPQLAKHSTGGNCTRVAFSYLSWQIGLHSCKLSYCMQPAVILARCAQPWGSSCLFVCWDRCSAYSEHLLLSVAAHHIEISQLAGVVKASLKQLTLNKDCSAKVSPCKRKAGQTLPGCSRAGEIFSCEGPV